MTYSRFDFVRRGPSFKQPSGNEQLKWFKIHTATASSCLERQLKHRVMLSLSGLPCCKSSVIKACMNCLESARMNANAATGSIGSIFDASMARGGRQQRPTAAELRRGSREGP